MAAAELGFKPVLPCTLQVAAHPVLSAAVLAVGAGGLPPAASAPPAAGTALHVRFGPGGFRLQAVVGQPGDEAGNEAPAAQVFDVVLLPCSQLEAEDPDDNGVVDLRARRLKGLWPLWSLALRFATEAGAELFEAEVAAGIVAAGASMLAEAGRRLPPTPGGEAEDDEAEMSQRGVICGSYALTAMLEDRDYSVVAEVLRREPRFCVHWVELHPPPMPGGHLEVRMFSRACEGTFVETWCWPTDEDTALEPEIAENLVIIKQPPPPRPPTRAFQVPRVAYLLLPSTAEAEALHDVARAAGALQRERDGGRGAVAGGAAELMRAARRRLRSAARAAAAEEAKDMPPPCFAAADRPL